MRNPELGNRSEEEQIAALEDMGFEETAEIVIGIGEVVVEKGITDFMVHIKGKPDVWESAKTLSEAIRQLKVTIQNNESRRQ